MVNLGDLLQDFAPFTKCGRRPEAFVTGNSLGTPRETFGPLQNIVREHPGSRFLSRNIVTWTVASHKNQITLQVDSIGLVSFKMA